MPGVHFCNDAREEEMPGVHFCNDAREEEMPGVHFCNDARKKYMGKDNGQISALFARKA
jgi:hypothetical protein